MTIGMLGLGSYTYRWSCGFRDRIPPKPLGPLDLLNRAATSGLKLVQFADNSPLHLRDRGEIAELKSEAKTRAITIELGMAGLDQGMMRTYLDLASELDAKLLRASLDAADLQDGRDAAISRLRGLLPAAREAGVTIALENHFSMRSEELRAIVEEVNDPALGVCLDVANSICAQEWPMQTVGLLAPLAVNLHLKDCRFQLDPHGVGFSVVGTPLGQGIVDVVAVLDAIRGHNAEINVILEHWLPWQGDDARSQAAEDEWLRQNVSEARKYVRP